MFFLVVTGGGAQEEEWTSELTLGTAMVWGTAQEFVFKTDHKPDKLSLLIWDIPVSMGPKLDFRLQSPWLWYVVGNFLGALPLKTGLMIDKDWTDATPDTDEPDIYSESTNFLTSFWKAKVETGVSFETFEFLKLDTFFNFQLLHTSWEGWNSVQRVKGNPTPVYLYGQTIDYRQTWFVPGIGGRLRGEGDFWLVKLGVSWNPWLFLQARDIHIVTFDPKTFLDTVYGGWGWNADAEAGWEFLESWWAVFQFDYSFWQAWYGDTLNSVNGASSESAAYSISKGTSGGDMSRFGLFLGVRFVIE